MKIVILEGYTENPGDLSWSGFEQLGETTVYDRTEPKDVASRIGSAEIVLTNKTPITAEDMAKCPSLRYIGILATGYNIVDIEAARQRGIPVCNIPTYGTTAVAQFVFALLLEICHHVGLHDEDVHRGGWGAQPDFSYWKTPLIELSGKTMGIVGYGRIGRNVAQIAESFGMKVLAYDAKWPEDGKPDCAVELEELLRCSDVVSLHCPLFPETREMINQKTIAQMKDGAILINTSRGQLVCEEDLAMALKQGKLYAAGLDVVSTEPIKENNPLLECNNCIITPHIAWAPKESRIRLMDVAVKNLESFLHGKPINVVNGVGAEK